MGDGLGGKVGAQGAREIKFERAMQLCKEIERAKALFLSPWSSTKDSVALLSSGRPQLVITRRWLDISVH